MANVLEESKRQQILALGRLKWPLRRIEHETGIRRETASSYLKAAGIAVRPPRCQKLPSKPASHVSTDPGGDSKPASQASTDSGGEGISPEPVPSAARELPSWPPPLRAPAASACEPYRELIEEGLRHKRNAMAIWQGLVDDHGFAHGYSSVRRYVANVRAEAPESACGFIDTKPGEEAQVDYGEGPMVRNPATGKYRRTRLFVLTLGYSRKSVRLLSFRSSSRIWCELHETAFRRLGGVTSVIVLDNLKEGVLSPDIYDPAMNPLFHDFLKYHGSTALPCRVRDPDRKGKVESGVGHAQRTPLKGLRFETLDEAQAYLDRWEERWADTRIHGTTKRQVAAMFAEEKPSLISLPVEPFRYYAYGVRTVHLDGFVEVEGAYYRAVPPARIGDEVSVQWDGRVVRILDRETSTLMREYRRQERGGRRLPEGEPQPRTPKTTEQLLARAAYAGRSIGLVCAAIHRDNGEIGVRQIIGVLALARKHGRASLDDACKIALDVGTPSYRFVRRYIDHKMQLPLTLRQVDPLIRELTHYRDFVRRQAERTAP